MDSEIVVDGNEHQIWVPKPKARLNINEGFLIESVEKRPNAWWRFWQYFLLGWKWEKLDV